MDIADRRKADPPTQFRHYYLAAGCCFAFLWCTSVAIGLALGPVVPASWGLEFAVPVMFTGMLVPSLTTNPKWVAALVAAAVTVLCAGMPNRSGLLVGAVAGIAAGVLADRRASS